MKLKKYFITFLSASLLVANTLIISNDMGRVEPSKVKDGAPPPKSKAAAAVVGAAYGVCEWYELGSEAAKYPEPANITNNIKGTKIL